MSGQAPIPPSYARQASQPYVRKTDVKRDRKQTAYANRRVVKAAPRYTRAGVAKLPPSKIALKVSACAMRYMAALCNPFQAEPGACLPCDLFPLPSQKLRPFTRGTFQLGTTGFGFIQVAPTTTRDAPACIHSNAATVMSSSTTIAGVVLSGNWGSQTLSSLPYTIAQTAVGTGTLQSRVVSLGVRVRYAGIESTRSGTIACYEEQDHVGQAVDGMAWNGVLVHPSATVSRPSGDGSWDGTVCTSGPVSPLELEFNIGSYPARIPTEQTIAFAGYLAIFVAGSPGDKYDFEIFEHIEYIGTAVPGKTPSFADTDQYGKIAQSAKEIAAIKPLSPASGPTLFERFSKKVSESLPQLVNLGVGALRAFEGDAGGYAQLLGGAASMIMADDGQGRVNQQRRRPAASPLLLKGNMYGPD